MFFPRLVRWLEVLQDRDQAPLGAPVLDVSHHQGEIDWEAAAAAQPISPPIAYVKATEGVGYVDPRLRENAARATEAGWRVGAYHFGRPDSGSDPVVDARAEMEALIDVVRRLPDHGLPPAIDWEIGRTAGITRAVSSDHALRWLRAAIDRLDRRVLVYTNRWTLRRVVGRGRPVPPWLRRAGLWWAEHTNRSDPVHAPADWPLVLWQHTARGRVPGIRGRVDLNRVRGCL